MIYVITVMSGKELDAADVLRKMRYEAYVPRSLKRYRKGKDIHYIAQVMFDGYVFVNIPHELNPDDYYKIRSINTVGNFLSRNVCLSDTESEYIKMLCNNGEIIGISKGILENGSLKITEGWLKRFEHKIVSWSVRQHKATVELAEFEMHIQKMAGMTKDNDRIFKTIPRGVQTHYYRAYYAQAYYNKIASPLYTLSKKQKYYMRNDRKGDVYDKEAMFQTSIQLGHSRISVIAAHYLYVPKAT